MTTNGHTLTAPTTAPSSRWCSTRRRRSSPPAGSRCRCATSTCWAPTASRTWSRIGSCSIDGADEEAALGRAVEMAPEYEDEFETEDGRLGQIRFEGIVALKELDDPPASGTEVWHEFMAPPGVETAIGRTRSRCPRCVPSTWHSRAHATTDPPLRAPRLARARLPRRPAASSSASILSASIT